MQNSGNAVREIEVDRLEHIDLPFENQIANRRMPGIVRPTRRRAAVLAVADREVGTVGNENRGSIGVAIPCGSVERRVAAHPSTDVAGSIPAH